ncbi:hypothetical protein ACFCW2_11905 [Qipengyuania sp. DSG2-2]|uniref:hypothetical protein n=1 Tax=Qipengyuania sp. DGS2-2 TaxID=3349631 RepID=UPI0036D3FD42
MSLVLAMFAGALAEQATPRITRGPERLVTDHLAVVRFDCTLTNSVGELKNLALRKSGRQTYFGQYAANEQTTPAPLMTDPVYRILETSDQWLDPDLDYVPGGRSASPSVGEQDDLVFRNKDGTPVGLLRFTKHYITSAGIPISAFMPKPNDPTSLETLAGVCTPTRLEDQPQ